MTARMVSPRQENYDRIRKVEKAILKHGHQRRVWQAIDDLRGRFDADAPPLDSLQARSLFVLGESGAGKTTLLRAYLAHELAKPGAFRSTPDGDIRPVVYVEKAASSGLREFTTGLLAALGHTARRDANASDLVDQIAKLCHGMKVEVILVDEAHHLVEGSREDGISRTREFVKSLLNRTVTQFVFAGVPILQTLVTSENGDDESPVASTHVGRRTRMTTEQLGRRSVPTIGLAPYDWGDIRGRAEFLNLLEEMQKAIGCTFDPPLDGDDLAARMYYATEGRIGLVSKYLSQLLNEIRSFDDVRLGRMDLARIWHAYHHAVETGPRRSSLKGNPIDRSSMIPVEGNPFLVDEDELLRMWDSWMDSLEAEDAAVRRALASDKAQRAGRTSKSRSRLTTDAGNLAVMAKLALKPRRDAAEKLARRVRQ